ncbi:MAG: hypothetical protein Q8O67_02690 [Deltaproteobacteria bacterium]|nr:hypothetical protein [Deltaproteobacteria bacterium]
MSAGKIVAGIAGVVVVGVIALCVLGFGLYTEEVCGRLEADAQVVQKLGEVTSCDADILASGDISDLDTFIFDLEGSKAEGRAYVKSTSTGPDAEEVYQGILLVVGGEEILIEGERPATK